MGVGDNLGPLSLLLDMLSSLAPVLGEPVLWIGRFLFAHLLIILWIAWWLFAVNWNKTWRFLARGAWVPVLLLMIVAALVGSQMATAGNFWKALGEVALLVAVALFCGWLQGVFGWAPEEIDLEPPVTAAHVDGHH